MKTSLLAGAALALAVAAPASAATLNLNGATVTATLLFPDSTVYAGPATTTVGAGVEFGSGTFNPAPQSFDIDANSITLFTNAAATYSTAGFNGFRLDFTGYAGSLSSLAVAASSTFSPVGVRVSGDSVFINLSGQSVAATDRLTLAAVPEPATWALMILGFGAVGAAMRRRQVRTAVTYA